MLKAYQSCSLYPITVMNYNIHSNKMEPDYFVSSSLDFVAIVQNGEKSRWPCSSYIGQYPMHKDLASITITHCKIMQACDLLFFSGFFLKQCSSYQKEKINSPHCVQTCRFVVLLMQRVSQSTSCFVGGFSCRIGGTHTCRKLSGIFAFCKSLIPDSEITAWMTCRYI